MTPGRSCAACRTNVSDADVFCLSCGRLLDETRDDVRCEQHPEDVARAACVVCGRPVCSRCGRQVHGATVCDDPGHESINAEWRIVAEVASPFEADLIIRNLSLNGIPASGFDQHAHPSRLLLDEPSRVLVYVPADRHAMATSLLDDLDLRFESPESSEQ